MSEEKDILIPEKDGEEAAVVEEKLDAVEEKIGAGEVKSTFKKGMVVMLIALLCGAVIGFGITSMVLGVGNRREKEFATGDITITLTEGFTKQSYPGCYVAFGSDRVEVYVTRDDLSAATKYFTEEQYASYIINHNGFADCKPQTDDGLLYFVAKQTLKGETILHYTYVYKTSEDFWLVEFAVRENAAAGQLENISEWAHSVKFGQ